MDVDPKLIKPVGPLGRFIPCWCYVSELKTFHQDDKNADIKVQYYISTDQEDK